jgi:hypothetical protein
MYYRHDFCPIELRSVNLKLTSYFHSAKKHQYDITSVLAITLAFILLSSSIFSSTSIGFVLAQSDESEGDNTESQDNEREEEELTKEEDEDVQEEVELTNEEDEEDVQEEIPVIQKYPGLGPAN